MTRNGGACREAHLVVRISRAQMSPALFPSCASQDTSFDEVASARKILPEQGRNSLAGARMARLVRARIGKVRAGRAQKESLYGLNVARGLRRYCV